MSERRCPCGSPLPPNARNKTIRPRVYCSNMCRVRYGRYNRSYGQVEPRKLGTTKA